MLLNTSALLSSVDPFQETVPNARVRSSIGGQKTLQGMNEETSLIEEIKIPLNPGLLCAEEAQQKRKFTFCTEGAEPDVCATFMYDPEWEDILHASRVFKSKSLADDSKVVAAIGSRSLQALQDDVRTPFVETAIAEIHKGGMLHAAVFICSVAEPDDAITLCEKYGPSVEFISFVFNPHWSQLMKATLNHKNCFPPDLHCTVLYFNRYCSRY